MRILCILVLTGCGRIAFDPRSDAATSSTLGDGRPFDIIPLDGPLPAGLVAWYPFDDAAANTADVVGGINGRCSGGGCPTSTAGVHGNAFLFDGIDDCIEIPDVGQLDLPQFTISIWMRQDIVDNCSAFAKRVDVAGNVLDSYQAQTTTNREVSLTTNHNEVVNTTQTTVAGTYVPTFWRHLAVTYDGAQTQLFLDAGNYLQSAGPLQYDTHSLWIGCDDNGTSFALHWNGALDDLSIYNRALTPAEITALASM